MERSDKLIKFVTVIVFIALAIYVGFSVYLSRDSAFETVAATEMELRTSVQTIGWAVREESILVSDRPGIAVTVGEGDRVGAGSSVAISYTSPADLGRAEEIRELSLTISALESISVQTDAAGAAKASVLELSRVIAERDLDSLASARLDINAYVLKTGAVTSEVTPEAIDGMRLRLDSLQRSLQTGSIITAERPGAYSERVDGFESIGPEAISGRLTPSDVEALFAKEAIVPSHAFGKLVHGIRWYYVTVMDNRWASLLLGKSSVDVEFSKTFSGVVNMQVESVGQEIDGQAVVVLSSTKYLNEVAGLRELTGEVIFESASGIRVPRRSVHLDGDGSTIVYILTGFQAQSVNVTILGEDGDWYMVASGGALRVGNMVIARADNLSDGAVVFRG